MIRAITTLLAVLVAACCLESAQAADAGAIETGETTTRKHAATATYLHLRSAGSEHSSAPQHGTDQEPSTRGVSTPPSRGGVGDRCKQTRGDIRTLLKEPHNTHMN